jgi:hypothetical protein
MSMNSAKQGRKGPMALGELIGRVIAPVTARRGFATADLIAAWPEIAGPLYAGCSAPEKIAWPRHGDSDQPGAGVLFVRVDGPRAILVQHDLPQIIERINAYFGYRAVGQARIVQGPVVDAKAAEPAGGQQTLDAAAERALFDAVSAVENERLRAALERLGRGVHGSRRE